MKTRIVFMSAVQNIYLKHRIHVGSCINRKTNCAFLLWYIADTQHYYEVPMLVHT